MEYVIDQKPQTTQNILCCQCGTPTLPNASNLCVACIRTKVDITEGIPTQVYLHFCKNCERYLQPPSAWISCLPESRELLAICLKKLKGLSKVHLIDAGFLWTEPHSKRIKVKLTVQKEVLNSTILEQNFVVEFIVQSQMCEDCHRREAHDYWKAVVQVRQKVPHKRSFYYLEQLIMKQNVHAQCLNIKQVHEGLDFYYANRQDGKKMVDFLMNVIPCRYKTSERLISHDIQNNSYNYKHTFSVDIIPICKNDLVCLPVKFARSMSNMSQIAICKKVHNALHFIDPSTGNVGELSPTQYWRVPFASFATTRQLSEFTVIDVEKDQRSSSKYCQADVYLMKNNDEFGSDKQFHCRTHLGNVLHAGDTVFGFDFTTTNINDENLEKMKEDKVPEVVIVKKSYGDKKKRSRNRNWKLKELVPKDNDDKSSATNDYEEFLEDLEEDSEFRQNVNIYKKRQQNVTETTDDDDIPVIALEEMLDDLEIRDVPMESDED